MERYAPAVLADALEAATVADVERALSAARPGPIDAVALLSSAAAGMLPALAQRAREITLRHFGRTVQLFAPLYVSNACDNACVYCGLSSANAKGRRTLTADEIEREGQALHARGFRHVLVVSGESPSSFGEDDLENGLRRLAALFPSISIEVFPLGEDGYRRAVTAGADGLALYQETYDRELYARLHPVGRKRDFDARLAAPEAAARAGMRRLVLGSLLGLRDFRLDGVCMALHARRLARTDWRTHVCLSFPRIRPAEGGFMPLSPVSDRDLAHLVCAMRIALPHAGLTLSTREPAALRDALLGVGITHVSAGSRTAPGAYACGADELAQFEVHDTRSPEEMCESIRAAGFDPVWKDWDAGFRAAGAGA
ncbi:MAG: 2-iminoacetate synthase ThiH [Actinobacteria bacterium]|nr:MAG: 2-iminoacetate synthase ThiH [Actinomycetota bacterium]